jgi:hypothetical protein
MKMSSEEQTKIEDMIIKSKEVDYIADDAINFIERTKNFIISYTIIFFLMIILSNLYFRIPEGAAYVVLYQTSIYIISTTFMTIMFFRASTRKTERAIKLYEELEKEMAEYIENEN